MNELAAKLHMDPFELRMKNIVKEGDVMPAYYGQVNTSCALDRCLERVKKMIDWDNKYPVRDMGNGKVRAVGMGMAMQGSGITSVDVGSATIKVNDDGFYTLAIGAADMGTGCDTILLRSRRRSWTVPSMRSRYSAQTRIHRLTIPDPMRPAQRMLPVRQ